MEQPIEHNVTIKVYDHTHRPRHSKDNSGNYEDHSVDVIAVDPEGMMSIAFYNFEEKQWHFHSDLLYEGYETNFVWMYRPTRFLAQPQDS
jgi:hypothetical protein